MTQISGEMITGHRTYRGDGNVIYAVAAATGETLDPGFGTATAADVDRACSLAEVAFDAYNTGQFDNRLDYQILNNARTRRLSAREQIEKVRPQSR